MTVSLASVYTSKLPCMYDGVRRSASSSSTNDGPAAAVVVVAVTFVLDVAVALVVVVVSDVTSIVEDAADTGVKCSAYATGTPGNSITKPLYSEVFTWFLANSSASYSHCTQARSLPFVPIV